MTTSSPAAREQLLQLELEQIQRVERMRNGVVWAFIFISVVRGGYEIFTRDGFEGVPEGILRGVVPAVFLALMGFPLIKHFSRKAEARIRGKFDASPRRDPHR